MGIDNSYDMTAWHRPRILVVDDETSVRELLARVLGTAGYVVVQAASGQQALDLLARDPEVDLLITDLLMRPMNGVELAQRLTADRPGLPVLFTSGYAPTQLDGFALPPGAEFVEKPWTPKDILERAARLLDPEKPQS
jgi:CheY-like chemotaxis protein